MAGLRPGVTTMARPNATTEADMPKDASHDFNSRISRRTLVRAGLGAIAAPAVLRVIAANAQSRVIKIGHVSPKTGPLAGFGEADGFILEQVRGILSKGLQSGGRNHQVHIITKGSPSSGGRAAPVGAQHILGGHVEALLLPPALPAPHPVRVP